MFAAMRFVPPEPDERLRAIGPLGDLSTVEQRAFSPGPDFDPLPTPGPHDWLNVARERGQSFERFTHTSSNRPEGERQRLYLQPLGEFREDQVGLLRQLQRFGRAFFVRDVTLLPAIPIDGSGITIRRNRYTDVTQLKTRDILPLLARQLPPDACCVLGVTADDLYAHDTWSFVFGEAILDERVGVFSIARYDPRFYDKDSDWSLLLLRSAKVLAHEICHMLGARHCVFFNCLMNGSNHLAESDRRPVHLCPVDLRKLHWGLGFDIIERYRRLHAFWSDAGVADEVRWIERRLEILEGR